jgi:acetylornithine/N-succinyldiaminopimelate aminotransferase
MKKIIQSPYDSIMPITQRPDLVFERGEGSYLFDDQGKRYLDWVQGWAVNCLGHSPKVLVDALVQQAETLINPSPAFYNRPALELARLLTKNSVFDHVFFANSGAEANEGAIKLARRWGQNHKNGAHEIITFGNSFHGRTLAAMSASGKPGWDCLFPPQMQGFPKATLNDIDSVQALLNDETVAVMLEPIQGEAGVISITGEFAHELMAFCDRNELLLIFDEVQTGCGRTGSLYAYQQFGIEPDIMTLGKGLGGGTPLSALLAKKEVSCFEPGDQGGTFCGNPLICAAGLAVMRIVEGESFLASVRETGYYFKTRLQLLSEKHGLGEVRGSGLLLALELGRDCACDVVDRARETGLLLNAPRAHSLRFMPALNISRSEIDEGIYVLSAILGEMMGERHCD